MRTVLTGLIVGALLVAFVTVWVYLASQGRVPSVGGQLEGVAWQVRALALIVIAVLIGLAFRMTKGSSSQDR